MDVAVAVAVVVSVLVAKLDESYEVQALQIPLQSCD